MLRCALFASLPGKCGGVIHGKSARSSGIPARRAEIHGVADPAAGIATLTHWVPRARCILTCIKVLQ
jgi:hypothetical protein